MMAFREEDFFSQSSNLKLKNKILRVKYGGMVNDYNYDFDELF